MTRNKLEQGVSVFDQLDNLFYEQGPRSLTPWQLINIIQQNRNLFSGLNHQIFEDWMKDQWGINGPAGDKWVLECLNCFNLQKQNAIRRR